MARWIPSGLSAISGQISNFTKEVLAEGIEEIDGRLKRVCRVTRVSMLTVLYITALALTTV